MDQRYLGKVAGRVSTILDTTLLGRVDHAIPAALQPHSIPIHVAANARA